MCCEITIGCRIVFAQPINVTHFIGISSSCLANQQTPTASTIPTSQWWYRCPTRTVRDLGDRFLSSGFIQLRRSRYYWRTRRFSSSSSSSTGTISVEFRAQVNLWWLEIFPARTATPGHFVAVSASSATPDRPRSHCFLPGYIAAIGAENVSFVVVSPDSSRQRYVCLFGYFIHVLQYFARLPRVRVDGLPS